MVDDTAGERLCWPFGGVDDADRNSVDFHIPPPLASPPPPLRSTQGRWRRGRAAGAEARKDEDEEHAWMKLALTTTPAASEQNRMLASIVRCALNATAIVVALLVSPASSYDMYCSVK